MPKISVIIPVYNCGEYIRDTIKSVIGQTFYDFEIIVVDGYSTDNTRDLVSEFNDDRIKYHLIPKKNVASGRNYGLRVATADYVALLDGDDIWLPEKLRLQLEIMEANPEVALLTTEGESFNENGIVRHSMARTTQKIEFDCLQNKILELPFNDGSFLKSNFYSDLIISNLVFTSSVIMRKSSLTQVGFFDEDLSISDDYDYWLRIASKFPLIYFNRITARYRVRGSGLSGNFGVREWRYNKEDGRVFEKNLNFCKPQYKIYIKNKVIFCYSAAAWGYLQIGNLREARFSSFQVLRFAPLRVKFIFYILLTFLPLFLVNFLQAAKKKYFND